MIDANPIEQALTICAVGAGSSTHVVTRLRWFAQRGHRVYLLTTSPSAGGIPGVTEVDLRRPYLTSPRSRIRRTYTALPSPLRGIVYYGLSAFAFLGAARASRPDVFQVYSAHQLHAWLAGVLGFRPLVVTVLGSDVAPFEERAEPATPAEWLTVRAIRAADYITPPSDFLVDVVSRLGDIREKTERIVWGVSLQEFGRRDASALRRRLGIPPEARVILSPKILRPFYRIHLLVEALPRIRASCPEAVLVLSEYEADPEYREQIACRIEELDLGGHAVFVGAIDHAEMPEYYSLADVSVAVPPRDGMPVALLESLACETPHVLSRLPRYEEIVQHEESAYFVDPDPGSIAAGVVRLLEDEGLRSRIARQGRRIVEEQADLDEQASRVERRFRELAATIRPRTFSLSALLSAAAAYASFRRGRR